VRAIGGAWWRRHSAPGWADRRMQAISRMRLGKGYIRLHISAECKFRDPNSIHHCIRTLLHDEDMKRGFEEQAYMYSRDMIWPNIAMEHVNLFYKALGL